MNIHEYEDSLEYKIAVMQAAKEGQLIEFKSKNPVSTDTWDHIIDPSWDWFGWHYRIAKPKIAEGHNPDGLTEDQVGVKEGWRLLAEEEIISGQGHRPGIELWTGANRRWLRGAGFEVEFFTYRTRHPAGYFLPEPQPLSLEDRVKALEAIVKDLANKEKE